MIIKKIDENLGERDDTIRFLGIWDTTLDKGAAVTPHIHENVEEAYYLLEGKGIMIIGNERKVVEEGHLVYLPPKEVHTLIQAGQKPLHFITVSVDVRPTVEHDSKPSYIT